MGIGVPILQIREPRLEKARGWFRIVEAGLSGAPEYPALAALFKDTLPMVPNFN